MNRDPHSEAGTRKHPNAQSGTPSAASAPRGHLPVRLRAFSLLEMVGILAVLAILATLLVPPLVRQMDKTAGDQESAALKTFDDALQQSIMRNRYIPTYTNWASTVAAELGVDVAAVTSSPRKQTRFFVIDPNLSIAGGGLPYQQTNSGSATAPVSPRVMLLSSIGRALPSSIVSGVMSSNDFNALWNWNDATNALPATSFAWTGWPNSDDLRVQRVDLSALFVRLQLSTYSSSCCARYSIDSTNWSTAIPITNNVSSWPGYFLQNSVLSLYLASGSLDSQQILIQNSALLYYLDRWHGSVSGASFLAGVDIAAVVDQYMAAYPNMQAQFTTNQQSVVVTKMTAFMDAYTTWAASGFPYTPNTPPAYLSNARLDLMNAVRGQYQHSSYDPAEVPCP